MLLRKLSFRPTVDELKEKKVNTKNIFSCIYYYNIFIHFTFRLFVSMII